MPARSSCFNISASPVFGHHSLSIQPNAPERSGPFGDAKASFHHVERRPGRRDYPALSRFGGQLDRLSGTVYEMCNGGM